MKRILFVGYLNPGSTSLMRARVLKNLGNQVTSIDMSPPRVTSRQSRFSYRVVRKLLGPFDMAGANSAVLQCLNQEPYDVLWLEKAVTITARTLQSAKTLQPNCKIIGYTSDDMCGKHNQTRQFLQHLSLYDAFFTMNLRGYDRAGLLAMGCPRVEFTETGFDTETHRPVPVSDDEMRKFGANVGFIGTYELDRAQSIRSLAEAGIEVRVIGNYWNRWQNPHPLVKINYGEAVADDYAKAICATKINLCFLRKLHRDFTTQRSVEIPACGAFMLGERTDKHLEMFKEGQEAEFFSSNEELVVKVRYYLAHPQERENIAAAGLKRCWESGYRYEDQMQKILDRV